MGLLWTAFEGEGPLLLEEPEISLHPAVVKFIPVMLEQIQRSRKIRRQIIISTHSSEMLSHHGIGAEEIILLEPTKQGTVVQLATHEDRKKIRAGLSVADVLLPKSTPNKIEQLAFVF